ncbi:MAG: hypothetical protein KC621_20470, partial [Myxococcales bacterium]|nr:hypothetical protein [Myxococcales bacterium]
MWWSLAALAADRHWERLPPLDPPLRDAVMTGDGLVARDARGGLWRWEGRWTELIGPTADGVAASTLLGTPSGAVWLANSVPTWARRFDGQAFGPREVLALDALLTL